MIVLNPVRIRPLPIFNKYNIIKLKEIKPLSLYDKVCLSLVIPHGLTDLMIYPREICMFNYLYTCFFYSIYSTNLRYIFLCLFSLLHIKNDIPGNFWIKASYSMGLHLSWVFFPKIALSYLAWFHTLFHYLKLAKVLTTTNKIILLASTVITFYIINTKNINDINNNGLWIPLVIGHVINNS